MNALRPSTPPVVAAVSRRPPAAARVGTPAGAAPATQPPACEYAGIGLGNGFLLERAGERPRFNVIGEIG